MKIQNCSGKKIRVICIDGEVIEGVAYDYSPPQDIEPQFASITIDGIEIFENEIKEITEI